MAVAARDIGITREDLAGWLADYEGQADLDAVKTYIEGKLTDAGYDGATVNTAQRSDISTDETDLIDLVMADLPSYDAYNAIF